MPTKNLTILIVDDEPAIHAFLVAVLTPQGYTVLEARHAIHALQLCKQHPTPIHLLTTDIMMPYMTGRELAIHALALRPQMRVLCISGAYDDVHLPNLMQEKQITFLQKPFSPDALLQYALSKEVTLLTVVSPWFG